MKRVFLALCLGVVFFSSALTAQITGCDHTIGLSVKEADGRGNFSAVQPGDRVCIAAGSRATLTLKNFEGAAAAPIVFINSGGAVLFNSTGGIAIRIQNTRYFQLTGTGAPGVTYGFQVKGSYGFGVNIGWKTSDMEIDHVEVTGTTGAAIKANTHSTCTDGSTNNYDYDGDGQIVGDLNDVVSQSNFTQSNTRIHHTYIHDTGKEAYYIGPNRTVYSSSGQGSDAPCPSGPAYPLNPLLDGVLMYNNRAERFGYDGLNIKGAYRNCSIYDNLVLEASTMNDPGQEGGIVISTNSRCDVYNNTVRDGYGTGIKLSGTGGKVFNNVVVNSGRSYGPSDPEGTGIHCTASYIGDAYQIVNNTVVNPKSWAIYFGYSKNTANRIQNNILVNPGAVSSQGDRAYVSLTADASAQVTNNYKTQNVSSCLFTNLTTSDYSLRPGSPAIDTGIDLSALGIKFDLARAPRPFGSAFDVGAYEFGTLTNTPPPAPGNLRVSP